MLQRMSRHAYARAVVAGIIIFLLVPEVGVLFEPEAIGRFFTPDSANARCPRAASITEGRFYYDCILDLAWRRPSPLVDAAGGVVNGLGAVYMLAFAAAAATLLVAATRAE
jgi:hypothetical protein